MNIAVLVDINTNRESGHQIQVIQVNRTMNDELIPTEEYEIVPLMAALCEGICTLIHYADQAGIKPSYKSLEDCIKHITDGFADASYKGKIIEPDKNYESKTDVQ